GRRGGAGRGGGGWGGPGGGGGGRDGAREPGHGRRPRWRGSRCGWSGRRRGRARWRGRPRSDRGAAPRGHSRRGRGHGCIHGEHVATHRTACAHAPGRDLGRVHAIHRLARWTGDVHLAYPVVIQLRVVPAVDHEHGPRLRFRVALHLRRQLAHLRRVREAAVLVGDDPDRQSHQRHAVQLTAPILAEVVPGPAVLLVVLVRNQRVEHLEHLAAHVGDRVERDDEDEVVPPDVPDEPAVAEQSFHDVVEDARQDVDDPIAVVVALELIQVGVTYGEQLAVFHAPPDLALDLGGARQAGGRVDGDVARGAGHEPVEPARLLRRLEQRADHLVRARGEPFLHAVRRVPARQDRERDDGGVG